MVPLSGSRSNRRMSIRILTSLFCSLLPSSFWFSSSHSMSIIFLFAISCSFRTNFLSGRVFFFVHLFFCLSIQHSLVFPLLRFPFISLSLPDSLHFLFFLFRFPTRDLAALFMTLIDQQWRLSCSLCASLRPFSPHGRPTKVTVPRLFHFHLFSPVRALSSLTTHPLRHPHIAVLSFKVRWTLSSLPSLMLFLRLFFEEQYSKQGGECVPWVTHFFLVLNRSRSPPLFVLLSRFSSSLF